MAIVHKKICDLCGKESDESRSEYSINGYNSIKVKISDYNEKSFLLCDECMISHELMKKEDKSKKYSQFSEEEDLKDKVFDLLAEIVSERIDR
ncbi:hypothetical protein [Clostridium butyricum]|uniref:hypothetical protein n=1 Tax=Clostridium butyricum TaxID=1492 RepID=UPI0025A44FB4|nr:hypothetical protein [Clostridium butyricum]MDM8130132.1 hypothetical protein [Clostridium butyricum]MDM8228259.1 hypothetical protein [Clostridium butyricum]